MQYETKQTHFNTQPIDNIISREQLEQQFAAAGLQKLCWYKSN